MTEAQSRRSRFFEGWRRVVAWGLAGALMLAAAGWITHSDTQSTVDSAVSDQAAREALARARSNCRATKSGREALRLVIERSFAGTGGGPVTLPPAPPEVPPAVVLWITQIVEGRASGGNANALRDAVLAAVPEYRCSENGTVIPKERPVPLPPELTTTTTTTTSP